MPRLAVLSDGPVSIFMGSLGELGGVQGSPPFKQCRARPAFATGVASAGLGTESVTPKHREEKHQPERCEGGWRARQDLNLRPTGSKPGALSN